MRELRPRPVLPLLFGAKVVDLADWSVEATDEIDQLRDRIAELEGALRPFAEIAEEEEWADDDVVMRTAVHTARRLLGLEVDRGE